MNNNPYVTTLHTEGNTNGTAVDYDYSDMCAYLISANFMACLDTKALIEKIGYSRFVPMSDELLDLYTDVLEIPMCASKLLVLDMHHVTRGVWRTACSWLEKVLCRYDWLVVSRCDSAVRETFLEAVRRVNGKIRIAHDDEHTLVIGKEGVQSPTSLHFFTTGSEHDIENDIRRAIAEKSICKPRKGLMAESISSSNVYATRYFNARKVFGDAGLMQIVTFRLIELLYEWNAEFDALICASINGACIASTIAAFLHKPVIYLKNIGPNMSAKDEKIIYKLKKHERYVYIYDFMCMGAEQQRVKMLCAIRKADLLKSVGIALYRKPMDRNGKRDGEGAKTIESIVRVDEYVPEYRIFGEEQDGSIEEGQK